MKFFIDTASVKEIQEANAMGILDGVTTNPTHMSKEEGTFEDILLRICEIVDGPVSAEVVSLKWEEIVAEAGKIAKIHPKIVVKIPITLDGLKAIKRVSSEGIRVNVTLCFSATQALLAAKAGATYISPFIGRLDDIGHEGMELIRTIREIYDNYGFETQILAASVRSPQHVVQAALAGADVVTLPPAVIKQLLAHPLTDIGLKRFLDDWNAWKQKK
ncbi:MAG: fructose-6-phosphate aldolase [Candidatus Latescibacteria bacterium]|nr:fructose-6-phosphate aldolase [Candidatus Latescibacterota bacterium]